MAEPLSQHSFLARDTPRPEVLAWPPSSRGSVVPLISGLESPVGGSHNSPAHTSPRPALEVIRDLLSEPLPGTLRVARELSSSSSTPPEPPLPTAEPALDCLLDGGLARGSLIELVGGRSSGRFALVLSALAAATSVGEPAVLIDLGDHLDPQLAHRAGIVLSRLLWLRPRHIKQALLGAEMVLATGFPLVVVDLGMPPVRGGRGVEAGWLRLARAARDRDSALLVSAPYRVSGTAATSVLEARKERCQWRGTGLSPRLIRELDSRLRVEKHRGGPPGAYSELRLVPGQLALPFEHTPWNEHEPPLPFQRPSRQDPRHGDADSTLAIAAGG